MFSEQINKLRSLATWARVNLGVSANIEVDIWSHSNSNEETIEYRFWIENTFHESSYNVDDLLNKVSMFKNAREVLL